MRSREEAKAWRRSLGGRRAGRRGPVPAHRASARAVFPHKPSVCLERALASTEVFRETEGEPSSYAAPRPSSASARPRPSSSRATTHRRQRWPRAAHRRARAEMSTSGSTRSSTRSPPASRTRTGRRGAKGAPPREVHPYWRGKTVVEHWLRRVPGDARALGNKTGMIDWEIQTESGPGEIAIGYGRVRCQGVGRDAPWARGAPRGARCRRPDDTRGATSSRPSSSAARHGGPGSRQRRPLATSPRAPHAGARRRARPGRGAWERVADERPRRPRGPAAHLVHAGGLMMGLDAPSYSPGAHGPVPLQYYAADVESGASR